MAYFQYLQLLLGLGAGLLATLLLVLFIVQKWTTSPLPVIKRHKKEKVFFMVNSNTFGDFPSIEEPPTLELSVVIPAYNEQDRLPAMLDECLPYLERRAKEDAHFSYEVIVVSDGSSDATVKLAYDYGKDLSTDRFRVLELLENRGKGGAVRLGMLSARGRFLLFADADGATKFADLQKLEASLRTLTTDWRQEALAIGSRAHLEDEAIASRSLFRTILMRGFHFLVWLFAVRSVRDTQCGFKLMTRPAAHKLFQILHVERWAFDVELLFIAERLQMPIAEVAVNWTEIDGSKLTPFFSWLQMGVDLFLIWFRYAVGAWQFGLKTE